MPTSGWCASPMLSAFESFTDNSTSGRVLLKVPQLFASMVLFIHARAKYFIFACPSHCARDFNYQHYAVDPKTAQFRWTQRRAQTDVAQSTGKCERALGAASNASALHFIGDVE